jgi:hypothetical protein
MAKARSRSKKATEMAPLVEAPKSQPEPIPTWAKQPFDTFINDVEDLKSHYRLCVAGLYALRAMPGIVRTQINTPDPTDPENQRRLANSRNTADAASRQIAADFPQLRHWITVALWSHLESAITACIDAWFVHKIPLTDEMFGKIKVSVSAWESKNVEEKSRWLLTELTRNVSSDLKPGVGRFESILHVIGLEGSVRDDLRKSVFELSEVRNLLVHRGGVIDERFADRCFSFKSMVGQRINITETMLDSYFASAIHYATIVLARIAKHHGYDVHDVEERLNGGNGDSRQI